MEDLDLEKEKPEYVTCLVIFLETNLIENVKQLTFELGISDINHQTICHFR